MVEQDWPQSADEDSRDRFLKDLRALKDRSKVSIRALEERTEYSRGTIADVNTGRLLPREPLTHAIVEALGTSPEEVERWVLRCRNLRLRLKMHVEPSGDAPPEASRTSPTSDEEHLTLVPALADDAHTQALTDAKRGAHPGVEDDGPEPTRSDPTSSPRHIEKTRPRRPTTRARVAAAVLVGLLAVGGAAWAVLPGETPAPNTVLNTAPTTTGPSASGATSTSTPALTSAPPTTGAPAPATPTTTSPPAAGTGVESSASEPSPTATSPAPLSTQVPENTPPVRTPAQPSPSPILSAAAPSAPAPAAEPPRPQCPGEACEGESPFNAADCHRQHSNVTPIVAIDASDGTPIATLSVAASERCGTRWAKVSTADKAERRIIVDLITNDGLTITSDETDDFAYTTMLLARPGLCFIGKARVYPRDGGQPWVAQTTSTC